MTARVRTPSDKRFRRAQVKPARRKGITLRQAWIVARVSVALAIAVFAGWRGTALLRGAPLLQVSHITISGNERLSDGEVLALLDGLRGENIVSLDLARWQARLQASPWVEHATLRRVLPSRVDVSLRERQPLGVARIAGGLYLVDAHGVVIDEYGPMYADLDLPMIDGLAARPQDNTGAVDEARASLAARVIDALQRRPEMAKRVSEIDVHDARNAVVLLDGDTTLLRLGNEQFVERIQQYLDVAPTLREQVPHIDYVDLRFDERVYVRPARSPSAAGR
jgi:cell division protein FtsQ